MERKQLYLLLLLIPIILGIAGFITLYNSPYTGLNFRQQENKWYIASIDPKSPVSIIPELENKEVVAIGGKNLSGNDLVTDMGLIREQKEFWRFLAVQKELDGLIRVNKPLSIAIRNEKGAGQEVTIIPTHTSVLNIIKHSWALLLTALLFMTMAAIVIMRTNTIIGKIFFFMALSGSMFYMAYAININRSPGMDFIPFIAFDLCSIFMYYSIAIIWHFCMVFPKASPISRNRAIIVSMYILPLVIYILVQTRVAFWLFDAYFLVMLLWSVSVLLYNYFTIDAPIEKAQARWVVWGLATFAIVEVVFYFLPSLISQRFLIDQTILLLFASLIPLGMALAIMRYKLMDIDTIFDNTLIYTLTIALLALFDMLVVYVLAWVKILQVFDVLTLIISIWLIILLYLPVRDFISRWIKKILKREVYDPNQISLELSRRLLSAADIEEAFRKTSKSIEEALHPTGSGAYLISNGTSTTLWEDDNKHTCSIEHIKTEATPLYQMCDIEDIPRHYTGGVYIPVKAGSEEIFGYIMLQNKQSQRLYDTEDLKLLNTLANQLAMAAKAINIREELKQKEIETIKEKNRIAREIHDGIGTNLVQLKLLMNMADKDEDIKTKLTHLIDEGISEMRELIWVAEKDAVRISELVSYLESRLNQIQNILPIHIKAGIANDVILPATLKLNIIRLVQEAVTNILKHAGATKISVEFIQNNDNLTIKIADNGKGFDTSLDPTGNGLRNMRKRCDEIGAKLSVASTVNLGTTIQIEIKLNNPI